ncbi:PA14 domain protein [Anaerohalosphaera lusitana]|uniref:PA14 domain protein n=1 Tax=Anaerohalosphaera lusitana TaxID=1936003 RepID=A0A1U9NN92_9BACT|nr:C25 family cysteine peptidase [Anaerohalosphaera lusitana]AQT69305.1 PA14 domain protein [Anaerohalosphaera lusitana]
MRTTFKCRNLFTVSLILLIAALLAPASLAAETHKPGYAIITTDYIAQNSAALPDFLAHKSARGFNVILATQSDFGSATGQPAADNIRNFLAANHTAQNITYVLLLGNPHPTSGTIPMKLVQSSVGDSPFPTDTYYADLDGNWPENADGNWEVYPGRIPYYGESSQWYKLADVDHILRKCIAYENAAETEWRNNAFFVIHNYEAGNRQGMEHIKNDYLIPRGMKYRRIYDSPGDELPPAELYVPGTKTEEVITALNSNKFGLAWLSGHSSSYGPNGLLTNTDAIEKLDDDHPTLFWSVACQSGNPSYEHNFGAALLRNGAIGSVAASVSVNGDPRPMFKNIIENRMTQGKAYWQGKPADATVLHDTIAGYNFYGDPSIRIQTGDSYEPYAFMVEPTGASHHVLQQLENFTETQTYTITNNSLAPIDYTLSADSPWLSISNTTGTINPDSSANAYVTITADAAQLPPGDHSTELTFTNTTTGQTETRLVTLRVKPRILTLRYSLDETAGTTASDAIADNHASLQNFTFDTAATAGHIDGALTFDGLDDTLTVNHLDIDNPAVTITAWLKSDGTQNNSAAIISNRTTAGAALHFKYNNQLAYTWNGTNEYWNTGLNVPPDTWTFVALTIEPGRAAVYMYDGQMHSAARYANHATEPFTGTTCIGSDIGRTGTFFDGVLDDLRIYNYALDASAIDAVRRGGRATNPTPANAEQGFPPIKLRWLPSPVASYYHIYLGTSRDAVESATTLSPEYIGRTSVTYRSFDWYPETQYFWRIDTVTPTGTLTGDIWHFTTSNGTGALTREIWTGLPGSSVDDLTSYILYPNIPIRNGAVRTFQAPSNYADSYGQRIHGYIIPPLTGPYTFYIAADDTAQLHLSTDQDPANTSLIAEVTSLTTPENFDDAFEPAQTSDPIHLTAGRRYYISALHKEDTQADHLSVAWKHPDIPRQIIPAEHIMPYLPGFNAAPYFTADPITAAPATEAQPYTASIADTAADDLGPDNLTFTKASGPAWLTVSPAGELTGTPADADTQTNPNTFTIGVTDSIGDYDETTLHIDVAQKYTGEKGIPDLTLFADAWLSNPAQPPADLNNDNKVNLHDLTILTQNWLKTP